MSAAPFETLKNRLETVIALARLLDRVERNPPRLTPRCVRNPPTFACRRRAKAAHRSPGANAAALPCGC